MDLYTYILNKQNHKFIWGKNDCCSFVCGAVKIITGKDPMKDLPMKYNTKAGAFKVLKKYGGIRGVADRFIGDRILLSYASVGDIVCGDTPEGEALGICLGYHSVFLTLEGTVYMDTLTLNRAWRPFLCLQ